MVITERGEARLVGNPPHHGWKKHLDVLKSALFFGLRRLGSAGAFRATHIEGLHGSDAIELTDIEIHGIPAVEISHLPAKAVRNWNGEQLSPIKINKDINARMKAIFNLQ